MGAAFGESVHGFLDFLASERRASRHTVSAYRRDLAQLTTFMVEKRGSELPGARIDVFLLRQWLGAMARVVAPPSVARKISAIKAFFRYLHHRGLIEKDPASDLASPKVRRPLPTFLGVDAAREVMEIIRADKSRSESATARCWKFSTDRVCAFPSFRISTSATSI